MNILLLRFRMAAIMLCAALASVQIAVAEIPILANWPQEIGTNQTGFIEFTSCSGSTYEVYVGTNIVSSAPLVASGTTSVITFSLASIACSTGETMSTLCLTNNSTDEAVSVMPRPFFTVGTMVTSTPAIVPMDGKTPVLDTDNDLIYFKLTPRKTTVVAYANGRSLYITNMTEPATLTITVKQYYGDGKATLPYIYCDGDLKSFVAPNCWIQDLVLSGSVKSVTMKGGTLGYTTARHTHDCHAQVGHGLSCAGATPANGLKSVKVKYMVGSVYTPVSFHLKGVSIQGEEGGILSGLFLCDLFGTVSGDIISNACMIASTTNSKELSFKSISANRFWDENATSNTLNSSVQNIFVAGMDADVFLTTLSDSNAFTGIIPSGTIGTMFNRSYLYNPQAVFVVAGKVRIDQIPPLPPLFVGPPAVKLKSNVYPALTLNNYWFVNGVQTNW